MTTQISIADIQPATLAEIAPVTITQVQITDSSWTVLDDSAVSIDGGYIVITGSNFQSGCNVIINSTNATSVSVVNSTTLRVQVPALAAGTYIVYVTNTNGGTAIIVNGLTYSGTPTWVTSSPLPQSNNGQLISIQLSATGDATVTYAVQAGSSLPPGMSLSSTGLLSGTVTNLPSNTTYNFTVDAIDAQSQDSPKAFSITILAGDTYWPYVSLLLGASTPTVLPFNDDASTNNFAVAIAGDTKPNNFNPYLPTGYYSNYFDGTGDYVTLPSTSGAFNFGTNDFTIEAWIYTIASTSYGQIAGSSYSATGGALYLKATAVTFYTNTDVAITPTGSIVLNTWTHVAAVRSSGTLKIYINGVQAGTSAFTNNLTSDTGAIGGRTATPTTENFNGYISNLRVVKNTAVYTANFTPPTQPLTAISGTSLLTCQSNKFVDNSINNYITTPFGNTSVKSFSPIIVNSSYSEYGSTYFDGTGDMLTVTNLTGPLTGDFTYECWVYPTSSAVSYRVIFGIDNYGTGGTGPFRMYQYGTNFEFWYTGSLNIAATGITINSWYHVAITRSGGTLRLFVNGTQAGSNVTQTLSYPSSNFRIGMDSAGTYPFIGYISDVRAVSGTALYTTNFIPPTQPLTAVSGTSLLTCKSNQPVNNNVFIDESTNNFFVTRSGNTTQGSFSPYSGGWSNYFDGTGDYLTNTTNNTAIAPGSGDFTIETWLYAVNSAVAVILDTRINTSTATGGFQIAHDSGTINVYGGATTNVLLVSGSITYNAWNHVAVVRNGNSSGNVKLYINGFLVSTYGSTDTSNYTQGYLNIGMFRLAGTPSLFYNGYISNWRMVKGTAVYTANFTPSTTPLLPITGTSLLTCADNRFIDDSTNNFTITRNGDVSVEKFSPFSLLPATIPQSYSGYFDGTGDFLSLTGTSAIQFGSDNFTIECWVYTGSSGQQAIYADRSGANFTGMVLSLNNYHVSLLMSSQAATWNINTYSTVTGTQISQNTWTHVAVVRSGTNINVYTNGTLNYTRTLTGSLAQSSTVRIASDAGDTPVFNGYISNFRMVKGTAVYTANFTPPTSPLTAIANTSLLTCQSSTFVDNSTNRFAITSAGDARPVPVNPFGYTQGSKTSYTPAVFSGSMSFDGSGDYLTIPNNPVLNFGNRSWTAEMWLYPSGNYTTYNTLFAKRNHATLCAYEGYLSPTNGYLGYYNGTLYTSTATPVTNAWNHVVYVFTGTNIQIYLNGVIVLNSATTNADQAVDLYIGMYNRAGTPYEYYFGIISDFRLISGTQLYTSAFVPPIAPVTPTQNTVLLLNGTSAGVYDSSTVNNLETVSDTKINTAVTKFTGCTSIYFDGTGDSVISRNSIPFGLGDFTLELWVYPLSNNNTTYPGIFDCRSSGADANGFAVYYDNFGSSLFNMRIGSSSNTTPAANVPLNQWNYIAVCRVGTIMTCYVNGVSRITATSSADFTRTVHYFGSTFDNFGFNGYIQDARITDGIARYTANFTPPTSPDFTF
jgi:hypothetical protein